jgi:hypothetical protein
MQQQIKTKIMCSSVSWSGFLQAILILSAIYYSAVLILFYRNDLIAWFNNFGSAKSKTVLQKNTSSDVDETSTKDIHKKPDEKEIILQSQVHDLMEELKIIFIEATGDKIKKPELLLKIQKKLKEYPQIKGSGFDAEVNHQIEFESNEQCEIILSDEELNMLWKG